MPTPSGQIVHLEFTSAFEMLDFVQVVTEHMGRSVGLDDDARHWVSVAIRESVINAIKHGNRNDSSKHVFVDLETPQDQSALTIRVRDEGEGFDPADVPDPTAVENLERPCGRGLMLMNHYMTEIKYNERGNSVLMSKSFRINGQK